MLTPSNRAVVESAHDCWNCGDLSGYLKLYSPDVRLYGYTGVKPGFPDVRRFYEEFWQAFPGSQLVFEDLIVTEDNWTHGGHFQRLPATGKTISMPGITILRFSDGKCVERWSQADSLGLLTQIGALPAPE